jgi:P pilus assembly chaperone PapD
LILSKALFILSSITATTPRITIARTTIVIPDINNKIIITLTNNNNKKKKKDSYLSIHIGIISSS